MLGLDQNKSSYSQCPCVYVHPSKRTLFHVSSAGASPFIACTVLSSLLVICLCLLKVLDLGSWRLLEEFLRSLAAHSLDSSYSIVLVTLILETVFMWLTEIIFACLQLEFWRRKMWQVVMLEFVREILREWSEKGPNPRLKSWNEDNYDGEKEYKKMPLKIGCSHGNCAWGAIGEVI